MNAGCRHPRGPSLVFSSDFLFLIFCSHSLFGEWTAGQLPAITSDGLFDSDLFLRHSSPPQRATDSILRPPLSYLCDSFACCSLPLRYADFLQNFCSAEICTTSLHQQGRDLFVHSLFNMFQTFSRNDLPGKKKKKKKIAPSGKKAGTDRFYFRIKGNLFF